MDTDQPQYFLPPGMWKDAEEGAQKLLDALPKENLLIDFVALMAALQAYLLHSEFPPIRFANTWEEYEECSRDFINLLASDLDFL